MRYFFLPVAFALALGGLSAQAAPTEDEETPEAAMNQWWCQASFSGYGHQHNFSGWSDRFPAGSGQGQQAHQRAYQSALNRCNQGNYYSFGCRCNFNTDCWVERQQ